MIIKGVLSKDWLLAPAVFKDEGFCTFTDYCTFLNTPLIIIKFCYPNELDQIKGKLIW